MPLHQPIAEPFLACTACGVFFGQLPQGQGVALDAQQVAQIAVVVAEGAGRPENYSGGGTAVDVGTALSRSCASLARYWARYCCEFHRQAAGSHEKWLNPATNRYTTIPDHPGDMPEGTLRAILKQAGIDAETFLQKK